MRFSTLLVGSTLFACLAGEVGIKSPAYKVLPPITEGSLTVFPVTADRTFDTSEFLTLDEGIRGGQVTIAELGREGLVRPRPVPGEVWSERWPMPGSPLPPETLPARPRVNTLAIVNHSDRPLILLAGEIVTGGKQDRVVGKDRIIPPHSEPMALDVFCVEPNRWAGSSPHFGGTASAMAQPEVRMKAMADQNQEQVWAEVAKSRAAFAANLAPPEAASVESSSSYAHALDSAAVQLRLDSLVGPIERSYEKLNDRLRSQKAVGAVVTVNGRIVWADVFASPALLANYWPKLIRSYAADAFDPEPVQLSGRATEKDAQDFLDSLYGSHESIDSEPGVYRYTEIDGSDFKAFVLTSLLPNTGFPVHIAKMRE